MNLIDAPLVRIAFIDVGQGDTIVVTKPETNEAVVVDCVYAEPVIRYLERENIKYFRGLIMTHFHADHCKGVVDLLENVLTQCESVVFAWPDRDRREMLLPYIEDADQHSKSAIQDKQQIKSMFEDMIGWSKPRPHLVSHPTSRSIPKGFESVLTYLHPFHGDYPELEKSGLNNTSVALKVQGTQTSALILGDLEPFGWKVLQKNAINLNIDLKCEILKFPHHGAWVKGDPEEVLDEVNPEIVVISVGTEGIRYKHPNDTVFTAISKRDKTRLLCTQATTKCSAQLQINQSLILNIYRQREDEGVFVAFPSNKGCPCGGSIIIDLGETAQVLQPESGFHRMLINNYLEMNRCS